MPTFPETQPTPGPSAPPISQATFPKKTAKNRLNPSLTPTPAANPYELGDQAFQERSNPVRARQALTLFRQYHVQKQSDAEAAWRHSMGCYFAGLHLIEQDDEKIEIFAEGRDAGLAGLELNPRCAPCHFWTAINMALYGQTVGVFKMYFSLGAIREHLEATTRLDPAYAGGGAYRLLGLIEQKLPGILGGDTEEAKNYFSKAIEIAPEEPLNYLFMMKLLSQAMDDMEGAKAIARKGISVPKPSPDRIESLGSLKELEEFLKEQ